MLYDFVKEAKFDKIGVFMYSKEDGTPAAKLPEQIHGNTKKKRYKNLMEIAQKNSQLNLEKHINKEYKVLIESESFDGEYYIGRTYMDIPDMDGVVFIKNEKPNLVNNFSVCTIIDKKNYDLIAKIVV